MSPDTHNQLIYVNVCGSLKTDRHPF